MIEVTCISALSDNYIWLLKDGDTGMIGVVDPGDAQPVMDITDRLDVIYNTHHHGDHVAGNQALKDKFGCPVIAPKAEIQKIPTADQAVQEGDILHFGQHDIHVLATPGHTSGHIAFWFKDAALAFVGDTLFAMGCGRVFEGTMAQMHDSIQKIMQLPDETKLYCGHEYTQSNGRFALSVDPDNQAIRNRLENLVIPSLPTSVAQEKETNLFAMAKNAQDFEKLRKLKDQS